MMVSESLMALAGIGTDSQNRRAARLEIFVGVPERTSFGGASSGLVLGVEVDDGRPLLQNLRKAMHVALLVGQGKIRSFVTFLKHCTR